jgi:hypothetical protein
LSPPDYVLNRHGSRVLDPTSAVRLKNQKRIRPTVYVGARLLLRGYDVSDGTVPEALQHAARDAGLEASVYPPDVELAQEAKRSGVADLAAPCPRSTTRFQLSASAHATRTTRRSRCSATRVTGSLATDVAPPW